MLLSALLPALEIGTTAFGALGSLFGGSNIPPEIRSILKMLQERSKRGFDQRTKELLTNKLKNQLSQEFKGLAQESSARLERAGAGAGVQEASKQQLASSRFAALGQGITNIGIQSEMAKQQALSALSGLVPTIGQLSQSSPFGELLGTGLSALIQSDQQKNMLKMMKEIYGGANSGLKNTNFMNLNDIPNFNFIGLLSQLPYITG